MQYLIMICVVIGLAAADFLTGIIKAYAKNDLSSAKMRSGGLNKLVELIILATACGLEHGVRLLGRYQDSALLGAVTGTVAAGLVFAYIVMMELISILENFGEICPDAAWVRRLIRRLRTIERKDRDKDVPSETDSTRSG